MMKHFLKVLLAALLCLAPTLGSDATQRIAALVSPQAINVDLGFVQVGNVGNLSVMGAPSGATFTLLNNPGGHFSISGTEIVADPSTPAGQYSLSVQASGTGYSVNKTFVLNFAGGVIPPTPHFFLGINISGPQNQFATFPSNAQLDYWKTHNVTEIRLPIGWSTANPSYASGFSGIQPTLNGPLDTTSTNYNGLSYVAALTAVLDHAAANGQHIYLDIHAFGCVFGTCPGSGSIGSAGLPISSFVDVWVKIVTQFMGHPGFGGIDMMNEWAISDSSIILNSQQAVVTGVRALGWTGKIYAEGANFTGAWNWVSGQNGIGGSNSANLYQIVDPANNIVFQTHNYPDNDSSGSNFAWALEIAKPGAAPPGTPTSESILVTRLNREIIPWAEQHGGLRLNLGETGNSADYLAVGGADNWQSWTATMKNVLDLCVANNIEVFMWGPGFPADYAYSPEPSNILNPGIVDFSSAGLQSMSMALIDQYTGYTGPAPTAYRVDLPVTITATANPEAPIISKNPYASVGVASGNFTIRYGGKITSPVTITPHATLMDDTDGGGTFTPATVVLAAGTNAIANFTYTPSQEATFQITTTNNAGWIPPPALGFSSVSSDLYQTISLSTPTNIYPLYNEYTPNIAPALRLQRVTDNQFMDWYFTVPNASGFLGLDRQAIQTWASAQDGIRITRRYNAGPFASSQSNLEYPGPITGVGQITGGSGYVNGTYTGVPLVGGLMGPQPALATVTVSGGAVTSVTITTPSSNFVVGDVLTASSSSLGGTGGGFSVVVQTVSNVFPTLDLKNATGTGYPDIVSTSTVPGERGIFTTPVNQVTGYSVLARYNQTSGSDSFFRIDQFNGPVVWSGSNVQLFNTGWLGSTTPPASTFTGSISGTTLTVSATSLGAIAIGQVLSDTTGHITRTSIVSGSGNSWVVDVSQTVASETMFGSNGAVVLNTVSLNVTNGAYGDYAFTYGANSATGNKTYKNGSATAAASTIGSSFTGTAGSGNSVVATSVTGTIRLVDAMFGSGVPPNTYVLSEVAGGTIGGAGTYNLSNPITSSGAALTSSYTPTPAFGSGTVHFHYFQFGGNHWTGQEQALRWFNGIQLSDAQVAAFNTMDASYYSTPLPDPLAGAPPIIANAVANQAIYPALYTAYPFASVTITDSNAGSPTDSVTITLTGAGTLSGTGISGSGPYTISSASAASVTATLQAAAFTTTNTIGATTTFTIAVTSSAGSSASNSNTSTVVTTYVAETPIAAPGGTFTPIGNYTGVNLSGGENLCCSPSGILPPTYKLDYFAGKGFGMVRLPTTSVWLYPASSPLQPLNTATVNKLQTIISRAYANGQYVLIDDHEYGALYAFTADQLNILPNTNAENRFVDMWSRIATKWQNWPNVMFGLSNEPQQVGQTPSAWQSTVVKVIAGIRTAGATQKVSIMSPGWHASNWVSSGGAAPWSGTNTWDPGNNFWFEFHQYLDGSNSGGSPVATQNGSTVLNIDGTTTWLTTYGFQGFIGEFGMGWPNPWYPISAGVNENYDSTQANPQTTNSVTQNSGMLGYAQANSAQWAGWAAWTGGDFPVPPTNGGYFFPLEPTDTGTGFTGPDQPQIPTLQGFIYNFLLKRDLDPSSNDNDPMWLEKAA